jgi:23S rRNA (pseudouridine1915-N3)-methyltransferase
MRVQILAVCDKLPAWVKQGVEDYSARLQSAFNLQQLDLALGNRGKNSDPRSAVLDEGKRMEAAIAKQAHVIALDSEGSTWSTEQLAQHYERWRMDGLNLCFLIGGPDGLAPSCLQRAQQRWSLGALTLPHALVKIVLVEQLFRAHSILQNHPYHRAGKCR